MSKFSKDLDETLSKKVMDAATKAGLTNVIDFKPIKLNKTKSEVGVVLKSNDLTALFTNNDSIVAIALFEEAFDRVDEVTQDIWIENLVSQVSYDYEKDKIVITKPELCIPLGVARKYGDEALKKAELAVITVAQVNEDEKERKAAAKAEKSPKKG